MKPDWYFDFVSPYSYLQCERLGELGIAVHPVPVVFAGLLKHWGHKGPAEMPSKRTFVYRQVLWIAERNRIQIRFPPRHPFNPIRALRLAVALDAEFGKVREIFRHVWRDGDDVDTDEGFRRLCERVGAADGEARVADPTVKAKLLANGEDALAAGVFGVPTLAIDGELFWGFDATEMALDYMRDPAAFVSPEMKRLDDLPVGASRG